jgi:hypothetical protein
VFTHQQEKNVYNFTQTLHPYGDAPNVGVVGIDHAARYGYWEHRNGHEGGGLWFDRLDNGKLELRDFDGWYSLPPAVVTALRGAKIEVGSEYDL